MTDMSFSSASRNDSPVPLRCKRHAMHCAEVPCRAVQWRPGLKTNSAGAEEFPGIGPDKGDPG